VREIELEKFGQSKPNLHQPALHWTLGAQAGTLGEQAALGKKTGRRRYNSLYYPVCTRLSGMLAARPANGRPRD
jgi:hypothetical protein